MTSELVILTPSAVALAADSAVTLDDRKIYNGINKLFMLSNNPPVGIMTYNNVSFLNIPFETIIKEFRKILHGSKEQNCIQKFFTEDNEILTVKGFQKAFIEYLHTLVPKSDFKTSFDDKLNFFVSAIISKKMKNPNFFEEILNLKFSNENLINELLSHIDDKDLEKCKEKAINICSQLNKDSNELFIENFKKFFILELFVKQFTGIALAGFDEEKLFPCCCCFKIIYLFDEKFITYDFEYNEISLENDGFVVVKALAQYDVIQTFLNSIDLDTKSKILDFFNEFTKNFSTTLKESINNNPNIDENSKNEIFKEIDQFDNNTSILDDEFKKFIEDIEDEHVFPILQSIRALPYVELSNLCESLIKITSLKRKVQSDLESVGGDVDVAIITKGDGFIWTKRKHYFDGDLNYQFFERRNDEKF